MTASHLAGEERDSPRDFLLNCRGKSSQKEMISGIAAKLETLKTRKKKQASFQPLRMLPRALGQMVMSPRGCFVSQGAQVPVKTSETRQC